jgi:hypothetical protein
MDQSRDIFYAHRAKGANRHECRENCMAHGRAGPEPDLVQHHAANLNAKNLIF